MSDGRFGIHGGQYIPETLMNEIINLEKQYNYYKNDPEFCQELDDLLKNYAGRPSLIYYAEKMTKDLGGAKIYLKREDLNHTGAHKINNVLGQCLLAKRMGKTRVIAETGAGQHGVATATAAALMGLECEIFMGKEDTDRQALTVDRMELLLPHRPLPERIRRGRCHADMHAPVQCPGSQGLRKSSTPVRSDRIYPGRSRISYRGRRRVFRLQWLLQSLRC